MDKTLSFSIEHKYPERQEGITLSVVLGFQDQVANIIAKIDTGAEYCLFRYEHAIELGLIVERGIPITMDTLGGPLEAYGHNITIQALEVVFESFVYFAKHPGLSRNLLGRNGWLRNLKLAIIDYDNLLYLSRYDG